jgi:hypothetical protein
MNPRLYRQKLTTLLSLFILSLISIPVFSQESSPIVRAKFTQDIIKLDGSLDEAAWETAESSVNFTQFFPTDSRLAEYPTTFKILYSESMLYIGIRAETMGVAPVVSSLRRDYSSRDNDNVTLMFDTFSDGSNAFLFGATAYGVQRDALVSDGGAVLNASWDEKWQTEATLYEDHYIIEMAIPFSSLKYREGVDRWRLQTYRWNISSNEQSAWAKVPQNQQLSNLASAGTLIFEGPLGKSHSPIAVIPYANTIIEKDYVNNDANTRLKVGGDAKIAIGDGMNLDITINPDFSNVEVDNIFTNLTRFEVQLPEKRQFFIDNSDLFSNFGSAQNASPFFSRRIGMARDASGNLTETQILGGLRLSGKLNNNWRLGLLSLQTAEDLSNEVASNNNLMFALQRKVFSRSNIGIFWVNREAIKNYDFLAPDEKYNRVVGIDYNLASQNNEWTGRFYVHKSFKPGDNTGNFSSQATLSYNSRFYGFTSDLVYVDDDFQSDLGFIPRTDMLKSGNKIIRNFYPKSGIISSLSSSIANIMYWKPTQDLKRTDQDIIINQDINFKNQSTVEIELSNQYVYLLRDFDPTRTTGAIPLPGNKGYRFNEVNIEYQSNRAKLFNFNASSTIGSFYNGDRLNLGTTLTMRFQPKVLLSLALNYDKIRLPDPYPDADLWLVSPKVDITFNKSLFWSSLIQYSNKSDNLGINSRLQWRFAPLSDLYLVYNDNYFTNQFGPRYRSINLKFTYWLNI